MSENSKNKSREELIHEIEKTREERDFYCAILDGMDETIELYNPDNVLLYSNRALVRHTGFTEEEIAHFDPAGRHETEDLAKVLRAVDEVWSGPVGTSVRMLHRVRDKHGNRLVLDSSIVNCNAPPLNGLLCVGRVISSEEEFAASWKDVDEALSAVFNGVHDAIFLHDGDGRIVRLNETAFEMFGIEPLPRNMSTRADRFYGPAGGEESIRDIWKAVLAGNGKIREWKAKRHDNGSLFDVEVVFSRVHFQSETLILVTVRDVSVRKRAEEELRAALMEKEALLREVHHRVRNNLAVISSLLRLQARRMDDQSMAALFAEADFRVRCIGMVHEKLYQSKSIGHLSVKEYLNSLIDQLLDVYGERGRLPTVRRDIQDISLPPDTALPLGFITLELFSNALKHAFPTTPPGEITVSLGRTGDDEAAYLLAVRDNGVGMHSLPDLDRIDSLGLRLVRTFAEQLRGEVSIQTGGGTRVEVTFKGGDPA